MCVSPLVKLQRNRGRGKQLGCRECRWMTKAGEWGLGQRGSGGQRNTRCQRNTQMLETHKCCKHTFTRETQCQKTHDVREPHKCWKTQMLETRNAMSEKTLMETHQQHKIQNKWLSVWHSRDFVFHDSRHFLYSRDFVVSPVSLRLLDCGWISSPSNWVLQARIKV